MSLSRTEQLRLTLAAVRVLAEGPIRVVDLARRLHVGQRAAYRLLEALQELGLKLRQRYEGRIGYWYCRNREASRWLRSVGAAPPGLIGVKVVPERRGGT